jgi:DNA-binding response OmpR family regulator
MDRVSQFDTILAAVKAPTTQPKLLLVEDSDDDAFFFYRSLAKTGLACDCAHVSTGKDATSYLQENQRHPHLVFLDLKLPLLNGFEVLEWLQNQPFKERMKVIILSGSGLHQDIVKAQKFGVEYLVKPISEEILAQKIRSWFAE